MSADPSIDLSPELIAWAKSVLHLFYAKARDLNITKGELFRSFKHHVYWHSGGNLNKVMFVFEYYGKFVDMGVGRGVKLADRDAMVAADLTLRRRKPWIYGTIYKQLPTLRSIIADQVTGGLSVIVARSYDEIKQFPFDV